MKRSSGRKTMDVDLGEELTAYIEEHDVIFQQPVTQMSHRQVTKLCEAMAEYNRTHHTD